MVPVVSVVSSVGMISRDRPHPDERNSKSRDQKYWHNASWPGQRRKCGDGARLKYTGPPEKAAAGITQTPCPQ